MSSIYSSDIAGLVPTWRGCTNWYCTRFRKEA